ncbi:hypothetical protein J6590_029717 [Homalodisca vitripennis]|nr:hypothetical protein J6590_029717 [Homalodisca vitripennis]
MAEVPQLPQVLPQGLHTVCRGREQLDSCKIRVPGTKGQETSHSDSHFGTTRDYWLGQRARDAVAPCRPIRPCHVLLTARPAPKRLIGRQTL